MCMKENNDNRTIQEDLNTIYQVVKLLDAKVSYLSERVAWSETCFKRVEDSGVIHMAGVIRKMAKDLEMLQINHNKLTNFVKTHVKVEQEQEGSGGTTTRRFQPTCRNR